MHPIHFQVEAVKQSHLFHIGSGPSGKPFWEMPSVKHGAVAGFPFLILYFISMGVKYGRGFLRSQNVAFAEIDWDDYSFDDVIYIDLLGSFYGFLLNLEERQQATTLKFINWFRHRNVVVVVDGAPSRQKAYTAASRSKSKSKELEEFVKGSIQIADLKEKGKRVSKAKWTNWDKLKRRTFNLKGSIEFIYFLEQVAAAGIQIVHAAGEADV
jgi:hypothetical protein